MSPRPRKVSDDEVFGAVHRVMHRVRPGELTLVAVGEEAGVTAGALVQRFGSKQGLMRALNARFAEGTDAMLASLRAAHASPLAAVHAWAAFLAGMAETPATLAHHLAWLEMDLSDPETYEQVARHTRATRRALGAWLREAVAVGELLSGADPAKLARMVHTTATGSMMSFPFFRKGRPAAWIREDLDLVLGPYRR